ncbi:MAG: hypothetical protein ACRDP6_25290 [Actinoallomurus sp.]
MEWGRERYRLEVLEPARRAGNVPPDDLFARYGVPEGNPGPEAFDAQVERVLTYWRELRSKRTYGVLAGALLGAHTELLRSGPLSHDGFTRHRDRARKEQLGRLTLLVDTERGVATHVGPLAVARLRAAAGRAVTGEDVREALTKAGVTVVAPLPELPKTPPAKFADLSEHLAQLGVRLSAEVVFGADLRRGFRVLDGFELADGRRLDDKEIATARERLEVLPHSDPAKTPSANVLAILRNVAQRPGQLDALVLWEILDRLRPMTSGDFVQKAVAGQARELGLDAHDAGVIAATMLAGDTLEALQQQVAEELAAGRLRSAQRLATGLPAAAPVRVRLAEREAAMSELVTRSDRERAAGRGEQAARLLAEAIGVATDDAELAERLAALPPPPPRSATARVDGGQVLIVWEPSPTRVGTVRYRVKRGQNRAPVSPAEGVTVTARVERNEIVDVEAPVGVDLYYSVFASRGGQAWSRAAVAGSLAFAPDVIDLSVTVGEDSTTISWQSHPATRSVLVECREGEPARGGGTRIVPSTLDGCVDGGLRAGTEYHYRITACYRAPDGRDCRSGGVGVTAVPAHAPHPVSDLTLAGSGGSQATVAATWTPPPYGQVRLLLTTAPLGMRAGTPITSPEAARLGTLVAGLPRRGTDGRVSVAFPVPPGRHHLTALTMAGDRGVVGATVEVESFEPVRDVNAERLHDVVRLSWSWPPDATEAEVRWPGGELRCNRRAYLDDGGVTVTVGSEAVAVEVRAVYPHDRIAPPVRVDVAGRAVAVRYHIRRAGPLHPRRRIIEFTAERQVDLPAVVVVRSTGRLPPDDAEEGEPVVRLEPRPIGPDTPVTVAVELSSRAAAWLGCFIAPGEGVSGVLLFPPPQKEMRIR